MEDVKLYGPYILGSICATVFKAERRKSERTIKAQNFREERMILCNKYLKADWVVITHDKGVVNGAMLLVLIARQPP